MAIAMLAAACRPQSSAEIHPDKPSETETHSADNRSRSAAIVFPPGAQAPDITPERVCDHIIAVMRAEIGEAIPAQEVANIRADCVVEANNERWKLGEAEYARQAECALATRGLADLERCADEERARAAGDGVPTNRDVCQHVMDILEREYAGVEGAKTPTPEELQRFLDKCDADLEAERGRLGASEFERQLRCVMIASSTEELMACDEAAEAAH